MCMWQRWCRHSCEAVTCLEVDASQHGGHILRVDDEVGHALVARLRPLNVGSLGSVCDPVKDRAVKSRRNSDKYKSDR